MLSIIIVNYKSSADLQKCISSIIKFEEYYETYEFIVVDNDSNDEGLMNLMIQFPFIKLIEANKNGGFAFGNNLGISVANGDVLLLLNPDTWLEDTAINKLLHRLESDEYIDIIGPQLLFPDGSNQSFYLPKSHLSLWYLFCEQLYLHRIFKSSKLFNSYYRTYMNYNCEFFVNQVSGAALMMKKTVVDRIGPLDDGYFMYFEESDFCLKASNAGIKMLYYPSSKIIHSGGLTDESKSDLSTSYFYKSFKRYFLKNFGGKYVFIAVVLLVIGTLIRFFGLRILGNNKWLYYSNLLKTIFKYQC